MNSKKEYNYSNGFKNNPCSCFAPLGCVPPPLPCPEKQIVCNNICGNICLDEVNDTLIIWENHSTIPILISIVSITNFQSTPFALLKVIITQTNGNTISFDVSPGNTRASTISCIHSVTVVCNGPEICEGAFNIETYYELTK
ncbi:TPA: hypothetical protein QFT23_005751 [Bacillus cereus]|nr:hypothetical protein [Bacillus cereus]